MYQGDGGNQFSPVKIILYITYAVILFLLLYRFESVVNAFKMIFKLISPITIGIAATFALRNAVAFFERCLFYRFNSDCRHKRACNTARALSMALTYFLLILLIVGLLALIIPGIVVGLAPLLTNFPIYARDFEIWANEALAASPIGSQLNSIMEDIWALLSGVLRNALSGIINGALSITVRITGGIANLFLGLTLSVFMLYNLDSVYDYLRRLSAAAFGADFTKKARALVALTGEVLGSYLTGTLFECTALGIICYIGMLALGFDYALIISVLTGLCAFIPVAGAWISAAFGSAVLLLVEPMQALWFLIFSLALQLIENNFIFPRIMGRSLGINGLVVLAGIIIFGGLFGLWGMLLGPPIMALCYRIMGMWLKSKGS